jgi:hypothetical protein
MRRIVVLVQPIDRRVRTIDLSDILFTKPAIEEVCHLVSIQVRRLAIRANWPSILRSKFVWEVPLPNCTGYKFGEEHQRI